jgi:CBS domain containing-hemolysin-like protein
VTPIDWVELAIVVVLIAVAAVFAAAETSITRMGRIRAYRMQEEGRRGSKALVRIVDNPAKYLNVMLFLVLLVQLGGTTLATTVAIRHFNQVGEIVATAAMTILLFVFAEVTPKTFVVQHTDRVALRLAPIITALTTGFGPLAHVLIKFANWILPGKGLPQGPFVTEQEIKALAEVASEEESIEEGEAELIHSIFEFGDTLVREVMVPRPDMTVAPVTDEMREVLDLIVQKGYSRIPVYGENIDDIHGVVYAKDLLRHLHVGKSDVPLDKIMRPAFFVPETKRCAELLREMQQRQIHIAVVLDEYGSTAGLVTIEDLIEELVGEIADEYDREEPEVVPLAGGRFRVDGRTSVDDLNELLDAHLPNDEWDTVAGLMYGLLGSVPTQGQKVSYDDLDFTAEQVQGRRIAKVLVSRKEPSPEDGQTVSA